MTSARLTRRVRALLGGLVVLVFLAAPAPAAAAPVVRADPSTLLAEARSAHEQRQFARARSLLEQLVDEFDGTPEAVVGALTLLEVLTESWLDRSARPEQILAASDALERRALQLARSKSYRLPAAGLLRHHVLRLVLMHARHAPWKSTRHSPAGSNRAYHRSKASAYLDILTWLAPADVHVPDILLAAARSFEMAGMWPEALQQAHRVRAEFPRHARARDALALLVRGQLALARYEGAALLAEQYARQYPHSRDALDLLADAYQLRRGLGHADAALADLERFEATSSRSEADRAEALLQARLDPLRDDQRLVHLEAYLRRHDWHLDPDRRVVLAARIARLRWQMACTTGLHHDLCITTEPQRRGMTESPTAVLTVRPRDPAAAAELRRIARLSAESRSFAMLQHDPERLAELEDAIAMAAVLSADQQLEAWLASTPPQRPSKLARSEALARRLERSYGDIAANERSPTWSIAALARLGQLAEHRADAQVGQGSRSWEAAPLDERALSAYARCLERSIATGVYTEFSRLCEAALTTHAPRRFPPLQEQFGAPGPLTSPAIVGVQTDLELDAAK